MTYDQLKAIIIATIKPNGNQEITAQMLQDVLVQMTDTERANLGNIPVPTLVSDLENDLGYQTAKEVATLIAQAIEGKADEADIPTKTSQLANDSGFQTSTQVSSAINKAVENKADKSDIPTVPTNVSAFTNDAGYQTKDQVGEAIEEATKDQASQASVSELETKVAGLEGTVASKADKTAIPSKVSQLANDSEYQTSDQVGSAIALAVAPIEQAVAGKADASAVPTKVSQLENDSQYQTKSEVSSAVSGKADKSDVETLGGSVEALGEAVAGKASQVDMTKAQSDIGNVSNLATNQKTLVLAINEVFAAIGSGGTESVVSLKKTDAGYELYQGTALVGEIVFSDDIADGSIVTKMIADGAVTLVKLSASVQASLEKADTAVQPGTLSELVAQLEQAIGGKANISDIPTKVGELENDKGYQTSGQVQSAIENKVDKVSGKGLSTNDFTDADKIKLDDLENYDDTAIKQQIADKQDAISDLSTIRSGAGKGATAVQPSDLSEVATSGSYEDLSNKPSIPDSLSDLSSDSTHRTVTDSEKTTWNNKSNFSGSYNDLKDKPTIPAEQVNADWNATSGKARILNKPTIPAAVTESTVAGWGFTKNTGSYSKPSTGIPKSDLASAVQTSLGKADTALQQEQYKGTYSKPSSGIPKSDLASAVQTSLGKADSAIQSVKTINGQSIVGSGNIDIEGGGSDPKIATLQIPSDAWNAQYNYMMATGTISTAQYTEITNCATLRLDFGGGSFLESVMRLVDNNGYIVFTFLTDNYPYTVYIGQSEYYLYVYADPMFTKLKSLGDGSDHSNSIIQINITPGVFTVVEGVYGGVDVSWSDSYLMNYNTAVEGLMCGFQFTTGSNPIRLTLPDNIQLPSDFSIEANTTYVVTIFNNLALVSGWPNA